jgi:two-component system, sensor histidine kinase and response regulator
MGKMKSEIEFTKDKHAGNTPDKQDAKLVGMLAHNIKGPLGYLHNMIAFLNAHQNELSKAELSDAMMVLQETSTSLKQMISNLFYWSLKQQDLFTPQMEQVSIPSIFGEEVQAIRGVFEGKKIHLGYFHTGKEHIISDSAMLRLIIQNLLSNAVKFSGEHQTTSVRTILTDAGLTIQVMDEGVGMDVHALRKIREGIRITTKGTAKEIGTGIGLRMVGELVQILGGTVVVNSRPNLGTTFEIVIPHGHIAE